jgi:hypothetical protein
MQRSRITQITLTGVAFLIVVFAVASGPPAWAQVRPTTLADSQEPGSVIVFPKFIRGNVAPDGVPTPRTEFEVGVVCPKGVTCTEQQKVKIRFHYVCGTNESDISGSFICKETDFDAQTTVNGKLIFNPEGAPPENFITPIPQCQRGYLIGWVIDQADLGIKFDGLIGDAVLRESDTAVSAYNAIPIQANPATNPGDTITDLNGPLNFDGGEYQAVTGVIFGDVTYDRPIGAASPRATTLTLLTLDVLSNRPNNPTFVDINFYNAQEALLSTSTEFICWGEKQLSTQIDPNLTGALMGSRKGVFIAGPAEKIPFLGISDTSGPATLLGLVETLEGPTLSERQYTYGVFNDSVPVPTTFVSIGSAPSPE